MQENNQNNKITPAIEALPPSYFELGKDLSNQNQDTYIHLILVLFHYFI